MPGSGGATVFDDLPEWLVVEEILVRLAPKDLLRCRAVRKYWRSATSTDKFILDHHRRQPLLPILSHSVGQQNRRLLVCGEAGAGQQGLSPIIQRYGYGKLQASLDGFLIVSHRELTTEFFICNPAIRKCAPLAEPPSVRGFHHYIAGFYWHQPSREYRVLWVSHPTSYRADDTNYRTFYYVIAAGSNDARCIRQGCIPEPTSSSPALDLALRGGLGMSSIFPPVHHRGSLHWRLGNYHSCDASYIMVFDTAAETFRLMCRPAQLHPPGLLFLEMDGSLALCSFSSDNDTIDIWVVQDYDAETWSFKHRINLSVLDPLRPGDLKVTCPRMVVLNEGELLIQFTSKRVLRYGIDGEFLGCMKNDEDQEIKLWITKHYLQESVASLPLFHLMREENDATQEPTFFIGL